MIRKTPARPLILYLFLSFYLILSGCRQESTILRSISSSSSGIHFTNTIIETDSVNQLDNGNVYNGAGVGIADLNNDGLQDIFFTGNLVPCKLYLNKGGLRFEDVTLAAGIGGIDRWCRGVAIADIDNDGWRDIYISATLDNDPEKRRNLLYINKGPDKDNVPHFVEMAEEYGLADNSHTTQAVFFDYDNDDDLDVYLTVNEITDRNTPYVFRPAAGNSLSTNSGRLYRNDPDSLMGHPLFTDVTLTSGIGTEGYGNQASITDINLDGWKDIYVSNDYLSNDLLWINNGDGTFSEKLSSCFRHTSNSAMGNDIGDINNDGLMDVITLDMNPEDNFRKKMMLMPASYQFYQNSDRYGYNYQYTRNTLQLNQGPYDTTGLPSFSEISYYAGIDATDWSWVSLLADFNNDGLKDLFIGNGFPKDVTDRDFGMFRANAWLTTPKMEILKQVPEVKIHNYLFRNNGDLTFADVSDKWGLSEPGFSNGAAYADLDNDGDQELVINNINGEASLYRNYSRELFPESSNYLRISLEGKSLNKDGIGAIITIWYDRGKKQIWENSPFRGYLSTVPAMALFGLGENSVVDSLLIRWPDGKQNFIKNIKCNTDITVLYNETKYDRIISFPEKTKAPLFTDITEDSETDFIHPETDFVDFNIQKLIPHKLSEYGPYLATGDVDGNGIDDIITGGSAQNSPQLFLGQKDGTFIRKQLLSSDEVKRKKSDDMGIILLDADIDGDNDLIITAGGYEEGPGSDSYSDRFFRNDGKGHFKEIDGILPENHISKGCIISADFDRDGDPDLFVSGRVDPWNYPKPVSSFIYRNDSGNGRIVFTDITAQASPSLLNIGMVSDALFTDFDSDGWPDLLIAGEWMPLTFLKNQNGIFKNITPDSGVSPFTGWWNSLVEADFDNDGDTDYIAGNLGLNSFYRANPRYPVSIYAGDFDNNGSYDAIPSIYLKPSLLDTLLKEFPVHGRDDMIKQMLMTRSLFKTYKSLATAGIRDLIPGQQHENALKLSANEFRSSFVRNDGNNKFTLVPLPPQAQFSALNGMITSDFDKDGNYDVFINTNDFGTDVLIGRYDALNGLVLRGNGEGGFTPMSIAESGVYIPGNGKDLAKLSGVKGELLIAASVNRGKLKIFRLNENK